MAIKLLFVSLLYPIPNNISRGVFVEDHVNLMKEAGHDVRVVNPLPRMMRYLESRRSTLTGVARAPKRWNHQGTEIIIPRFTAFPGHPFPSITRMSIASRMRAVERNLGDWRPDAIICHTLWPVATLAQRLSERWGVPWIGVVHGHDFDIGLQQSGLEPLITKAASSCDALVCVTDRLSNIAKEWKHPPKSLMTIPCVTAIGADWARPMKRWKGRWRKDSIDILFPADPRRPEKNHLLALQAGEEMERRGWIVGVTTLRLQPRNIVHDRMLVADVSLITSKREAGPLVARESLLCGTPVVSVEVGEVRDFLPGAWISEPTPEALADGMEEALMSGWPTTESVEGLMEFCSPNTVMKAWNELLANLAEER
ncbi:MAG: glycosyltransferase [Candidatus Poseidonia sp.]|nr:glycosyltransferase [Poseidonia sp.]